MSSSDDSVEENSEKIPVKCECGKGYRVAARKAGKRITCKGCGKKVRVPGERILSKSSRGAILLSVGIDPVRAERNWEEESSKSKGGKTWKCSRCAAPLEPTELTGAYVEGELVCSVCRAGLEDRRDAREGKRPLKKDEVAILSAPNPERARRQGFLYGGLFFVGFTGPLWAVFHLHLVVALLAGALIAAGGGWLVYRTRT
jgi:hypothetical protein